jgi:uncharacterized protein (TIGR03437 family)
LGNGVTGIVYALGSIGTNIFVGGSISAAGGKATANIVRYRNAPIVNTPPTIVAGAALMRQQGGTAGNAVIIATVSDAETAAGSLVVTANAPGLTFSNITNTNGTITANVAASCNATLGATTVQLGVSDGTAGATANLTVNVTANTPPVLGVYPDSTITVGSTGTVTPNAPPSDNGSIVSITAGIIPAVFIGSFSVNTATGVITITDPRVTSPVSVTVTATDNCGAITTQTFLLTINSANTAPAITAATGIARQQGSPAMMATLATVSDTQTAAGNLTVTATTVPAGLTVTNLTNTNGTVTANVAAGCNAAIGANTIVLSVSDGSLSATANVTINVTANTPPVLGRYANVTRRTGDRLSVLPDAAPRDNGTLMITASAQKVVPMGLGLAGPFEVNATTGELIHLQLNNPDVYTVTVTATDNCGATATTTFQLTITRLATMLGFSVMPLSVNAAGQEFVFRASPSVTEGTALSPMGGSVIFSDESGVIGDAGVSPSRGFAELRLRYQKAGRHTFTARFSGDTDRAPSESGPVTLNINQAVTSVSAASYTAPLASEQIVAAFGTNLAPSAQAAATVPLPTALAGVTVKLSDGTREWPAPLFFVSPGQINYLIPAGIPNGQVTVTMTNGNFVSAELITIAATSPGLFSVNANGRGLAAAEILRLSSDGTLRYEPVARFDATTNQFVAVPIDLSSITDQVVLVAYGTGIRGRSALPTATIGGAAAEVLYAGAQGSLAGLDQVNIRLPRTLIGRGNVDIALTVDGKAVNLVGVNVK